MSTTKVSEALAKIAEGLRVASGYPTHTTEDAGMALAYGIMMGCAWALKREWEQKEAEHERATAEKSQ